MYKSNINNSGNGPLPPVPELPNKPPADLGKQDPAGIDVASLLCIRDSDLRSGILSGNGVQKTDVIAPGSDTILKTISELEWLVSVLRVWRVWDPDGKAALPLGYLRDIAGVGIKNFNCLVGSEEPGDEGIYISVRLERSESSVRGSVHNEENDKVEPPQTSREIP